jgi:hypothetical protein
MSKTHYFEVEKYTFTFVDQQEDRYIQISGFSGSDGSAYLTVNSGVVNYAKYSYHPKEKRFQYAFTDNVWKLLDEAGKGRPNKEKIKAIVKGVDDHQPLCIIFVDKSSLFRKKIPLDQGNKVVFPDDKLLEIVLSLENSIFVVSHRFVGIRDTWPTEVEKAREKIYLHYNKPESSGISGVAHLMINDSRLPWEMQCIGI